MQFQFDSILTESKIDVKAYPYSRILKAPSENLSFDDIANKYEIVIREKYPFLDSLLKNISFLNILQAYSIVVQSCNKFS